ncbi:CopG family transcriptional regulator [Paraneptunicella aestuarii]|uniref:type II toxin-antitoxin system Phd/YefM family antitoxin n=1 Tax=Paraneptunicella aestuarii TaxID=2831148 RepID=UPI001E353CB4|nr:type II toxin-antitoxin system Phd/YefM family antitoxin [Paraneptunicella aestuarii]UAA39134.1 CopG family transcriptional regulator [Paraneptunicella aestuarii]
MNNPQAIHPQYITTEDGTKTSVILSIEEYESLMEDIADLAAVAERREETFVSHEDLLKELKKDGSI